MGPCGVLLLAALTALDTPSGALSLNWSADGHLAGVQVAGQAVPTGTAPGGFALRDGGRDADWLPVTGTATAQAGGLTLDGRNPAGSLGVSAKLVPEKGWLKVSGQVRNLDGGEHAVSLRFALPVACAGWTWWAQLHQQSKLAADQTVHLGLPSPLGSGYLAVRPVAAVSSGAGTLGLVVPLDEIVQSDFVADARNGLFAVVLDFALTKHSPAFQQAVPFEFYVAGEANDWGLRAVLDRYYQNRPDLFKRTVAGAGGWFAWGDILRQPAPASDYGLLFHEQPESKEGWENDAALGIVAYKYIEQGMYQMCFGDYQRAPTRDEVWQRVREWAKPETKDRLYSVGFETQAKVQRICEALLASGCKDPEQRLAIGAIGQWPWIRGSKWAAQFPLNLSPTIPAGAGAMRLDEVKESLGIPQLNGIYLDSYEGHMGKVNYAVEQLRWLTYAPQFDAKTGQPCSLMMFASNAWVEALYQMLPEAQRNILPNMYSAPLPYPYHRFAVLGKEHWTEATGSLMQTFRSMANRKVVTQLPAYTDQDERFLRNLLLLDVFPGGYARRTNDPPQGMRASYRKVIPLLRMLDRLGWEPVTLARPALAGIQIERYGRAPGPVALCIHNPYPATRVAITVDSALRLPAGAWAQNALDDAPVEYARQGERLNLAVALPSDSTTLLVLGDAEAQRTWAQWLADDRLGEARRCAAEYRLRCRRANKAPATVEVDDLNTAMPADQVLSAANRISGDDPCLQRTAELVSLAADTLRQAANPLAPESRTVTAPPDDSGLPWKETFDLLAPERWLLDKDQRGLRLQDGRLEMELPADSRSVMATCKSGFPFVPTPVCLEWDFMFRHSGHPYYLMMSTEVLPSPAGGDEFLRVRIDGEKGTTQIRLENYKTPPSGYTYALTKYAPFAPNVPHHLKLTLSAERFKLELDDKLLGEGLHECHFARAYLRLSLASGHKGHGDVCWWDNLVAKAVR